MSPSPKRRKPNSSHSKHKKVKTSRGLVRIIAGTHRARRLPVLVHEGLRPTGDRVKETLFNWLMASVEGSVCLDMYAGSGSLGIEALSRGAKHVVFIEQDKTVAQQITDNLTTLRELDNGTVINGSALTAELAKESQFNIVFIDPPFAKNMLEQSIEKLISDDVLAKNAYVYIEAGHSDEYSVPKEFVLVKQIKTSQVLACLYQLEA
jgi:16S rRNA (guanine966-N2)-methyltransferase